MHRIQGRKYYQGGLGRAGGGEGVSSIQWEVGSIQWKVGSIKGEFIDCRGVGTIRGRKH